MCTVSFIKRKEGCFITSNRDEHVSRPVALKPEERIVNNVKILFPKDPVAGGTWFAINEFGRVGVLLNGAFENHKRKLPYVKSRGLILLEVMASAEPWENLVKIDLKRIEPFTVILFDGQNLREFRWDGTQKHRKTLDADQDYIWSSVTLYDAQAIAERNSLFSKFILSTEEISSKKIVDFHSNNNQDYENGFIIDRETGLKTFSVTQVALNSEGTIMSHFDLFSKESYHVPLISKPLATVK